MAPSGWGWGVLYGLAAVSVFRTDVGIQGKRFPCRSYACMAIRVSTQRGIRLMRDGFPKGLWLQDLARDRHASMAPTGRGWGVLYGLAAVSAFRTDVGIQGKRFPCRSYARMAIRVSTERGTRLMRDGFPKGVVVAGPQPSLWLGIAMRAWPLRGGVVWGCVSAGVPGEGCSGVEAGLPVAQRRP